MELGLAFFPTKQRASGTNQIVDWMGPTASLEVAEKCLFLLLGIEPSLLSVPARSLVTL